LIRVRAAVVGSGVGCSRGGPNEPNSPNEDEEGGEDEEEREETRKVGGNTKQTKHQQTHLLLPSRNRASPMRDSTLGRKSSGGRRCLRLILKRRRERESEEFFSLSVRTQGSWRPFRNSALFFRMAHIPLLIGTDGGARAGETARTGTDGEAGQRL
jgi:hypothetical protein